MVLSSSLAARHLVEEVILKNGYPNELVLLHSLSSIASWRQASSKSERSTSSFYNLCAPYFCFGFGGTHVRDLAMGEPGSIFTNDLVPKIWSVAYLLVYHSPLDLVYQSIVSKSSPVRYIVAVYEAIDSSTTTCGTVEKANRLFPESTAAPYVASVLASTGGSLCRYVEKRFRGVKHEVAWERPVAAMRRAICYAFVYILIRKRYGLRAARLSISTFHILWTLAKEFSGKQLALFSW